MSNLLDLIKRKQQSYNAGRIRAKTIKCVEGTNRFRILPGWDSKKDDFFHDFGQHFIKDANGELKAVYICIDKTYNKPCNICSAVSQAINVAKAQGDTALVELLKQSVASERVLMNVLHVNGPNPTEPGILEIAPSVFGSIMKIMEEWGPDRFLDLSENGMDIIIERVGKGISTKYTVQPAAKSKAVDPSVMKKIANLDEYVAQESEDSATRALNTVANISGGGTYTGVPAPRLTAPAPSAAPAPTQRPVTLKDVSPESEIEDVEDIDDAALRDLETKSSAPAPVKASEPVAPNAGVAPAVPEVTNDSDLDALLSQLMPGK